MATAGRAAMGNMKPVSCVGTKRSREHFAAEVARNRQLSMHARGQSVAPPSPSFATPLPAPYVAAAPVAPSVTMHFAAGSSFGPATSLQMMTGAPSADGAKWKAVDDSRMEPDADAGEDEDENEDAVIARALQKALALHQSRSKKRKTGDVSAALVGDDGVDWKARALNAEKRNRELEQEGELLRSQLLELEKKE